MKASYVHPRRRAVRVCSIWLQALEQEKQLCCDSSIKAEYDIAIARGATTDGLPHNTQVHNTNP